ncbi:MAG: ketoacyl-ACP synthase III [Spirochaetaceae bacterium]|jgi:3-oxoacyl-[acyl-carrier-protein] synthase-3|nr:ketoacyl-ACP synthase III [Spirochaetaceae bacterium]
MAIEIIATGRAVPPRRLTNDDLAKRIDTNDEWIRSHTGIRARHIADDSTACSDLALEAAKDTLSRAIETGAVGEKTPEELALTVDLILLASSTQDYYGHPATACLVQDKLGAPNAAAMDITVACSGFIYGLETAAGLLEINAKRRRALVIGSDILSRITDWTDRASCVLFGDGAGAVLLEKTAAPSEGEGRRGLVRSILAADGSGAGHLMLRRGGSREPFKAGEVVDIPPHIDMDGQAVYYFAVKAVTDTIKNLLKEDGIAIDDVDIIIPHQANARIVQAAAKRAGIPEEKFYLNIDEYANTSSASIPIALDELARDGKLKRGNLIMTVGFGAGLTYGGNLIVW